MIPNRYYPVAVGAQLKTTPMGVRRLGLDLVLWRDDEGRPHAFVDRCPHRGVKLSLGRVRDGMLECRYHGFCFDGRGACQHMPCEGNKASVPHGMEVESHEVVERHGLLWLWWGNPLLASADRPEIPWFDHLPAHTRHASGMAMEWPLNIVRTLESNFDLHHGPFVHRSLFPRRLTRTDPISCTISGEHLRLQGRLRRDEEAGDADSAGVGFRVEFKPPTLSWIELAPGVSFIIADCPIDDDHTWRYARYYNERWPIPLLGKLIAWALVQLEWAIVQKRQDLPVVSTQTPRRWEPGCDKLVKADIGTARFLKLYRELLRSALGDPDLPPHIRASCGAPAKRMASRRGQTSPVDARRVEAGGRGVDGRLAVLPSDDEASATTPGAVAS